MQGTRVYPDESGYLPADQMRVPGAYGKPRGEPGEEHPWTSWQVTAPTGEQGTLNPEKHAIIEHEDGTITVHPSIWYKNWDNGWHGWLKHGVWTSV